MFYHEGGLLQLLRVHQLRHVRHLLGKDNGLLEKVCQYVDRVRQLVVGHLTSLFSTRRGLATFQMVKVDWNIGRIAFRLLFLLCRFSAGLGIKTSYRVELFRAGGRKVSEERLGIGLVEVQLAGPEHKSEGRLKLFRLRLCFEPPIFGDLFC